MDLQTNYSHLIAFLCIFDTICYFLINGRKSFFFFNYQSFMLFLRTQVFLAIINVLTTNGKAKTSRMGRNLLNGQKHPEWLETSKQEVSSHLGSGTDWHNSYSTYILIWWELQLTLNMQLDHRCWDMYQCKFQGLHWLYYFCSFQCNVEFVFSIRFIKLYDMNYIFCLELKTNLV